MLFIVLASLLNVTAAELLTQQYGTKVRSVCCILEFPWLQGMFMLGLTLECTLIL